MEASDNREADQLSLQYECRPDHLFESDIPPGWEEDKTTMCAVSWLSQTPFTEISQCCTGPVHVFHSCFQYCATDLKSHEFLRCARGHMDAKHIGVKCNAAVWPSHRETETTHLMSGPSVFFLSAVIIILMACVGTQYISASSGMQKRIQSLLGVFLCFLFLMALETPF